MARRVLLIVGLGLLGVLAAASIGYASYLVSRDEVGLPVTKLEQAPVVPIKARTQTQPTTSTRTATAEDRTTPTRSTPATSTEDDSGSDSSGKGSGGSDNSGKGSGGGGDFDDD